MESLNVLRDSSEELNALLARAAADLDTIHRRFEEEFAQRYQGCGVNPLSLLNRLQRLGRELAQTREECMVVLHAKQELIDAARKQLIGNHELVSSLTNRSGLAVENAAVAAAGGGRALDDAAADLDKVLREWDKGIRTQLMVAAQATEEALNREQLNHALMESVVGGGA